MITSYYYANAVISILIVATLIIHLLENDIISQQSVIKLKRIGYFIIFQVIIDIVFKAFEGIMTSNSSILYLIKALELTLNPILPTIISCLFVDNNKDIRWIQKIQIGIIAINAGCQFVSLFCNFIFIIDENNLYQRTNYTYIYAILLFSSIVLMLIAIAIFSGKAQNVSRKILYGILIILITGYIIRIVAQNTNYDWLCVSIAFVFIDIYFVNLGLRLDPLTKLLNRQVYQKLIERINYTTLIIIIDANNFKAINDNYGHECGDKTLRSFAKCILKAYGEYGWCFRIGGDEFCVILKPKVFRTLVDATIRNDVYAMSENLMAKLDEVIQTRASRDDNNCLNYGVSQGYGIYYEPSEYPTIKNNMPLDKVIRLADMRMYRKKAQFKKELAENLHSLQETQNNGRAKVVFESSNPEFIEDSE